MTTKNNQIDAPILVPFLKWAGGKRWLMESHPDLFRVSFNRYVEPFLGGGSVFFSIQPKHALLSDVNPRLIEVYTEVRDNWERVHSILRRHQKKHCTDYYYQERSRKRRSSTERAAQFIYLNRTCWNGLFRVNLKGVFNVPIGTKTTVLLDTDNFADTAALLKGATIACQDFEKTLEYCGAGDFVYVDPPYTVKHNFNGFIKYNENIFRWEDQIRLRDCVVAAIRRGARVIVSNADHESVRDLYKDVGELLTVARASVIAGKADKRGKVSELLVLT
ncbi:MAG: DNA adenine methylase [Pigmentiphaga sp.]